MTTSPIDMRSTQMQMQDQLVQGQTRDIGNLTKMGGSAKTEAQKEKKLREACEGFESIFIQKMWQQMRATLPKTNMLQGKEEQYWQSMYDQELAKDMTKAGGIGLADMMYDQLSRDLVSASRTTASAASSQQQSGGNNFTATAAPLPGLEASTPAKQAAGPVAAYNVSSAALAATAGLNEMGRGMNKNADMDSASQDKGGAQDMYSGAAPQPEAAESIAQNGAPASTGQTTAPNAPAPTAGTAAPGESSPIVEQFLAELRQRQAQQQAPQNATPAQGLVQPQPAGAQGITVAQHSVQQGPGGMTRSQRAQLEVANKPSSHGVMPAMQNPASQASQATDRSQRLTTPAAPAAPVQTQQAQAPYAGQASQTALPTPLVTQDAQAAFVPPLMNLSNAGVMGNPNTAGTMGTMGNASSMGNMSNVAAAAQQATVQQAQATMHSSAPVAAQAAALTAQQAAPVSPATADQQPHVINTTFTTNIPNRNRRSQRQRGQRLPSGQPTIRSMPTPAPASPITSDAQRAEQITARAQTANTTQGTQQNPAQSTL